MMKGRINSFQSMGAVDGPGLRFVIFMQGCPLRCVYCHNPETWSLEGTEYDLEEVLRKIIKCRPYFGEEGGVTLSGGEPLLQWEFAARLFRRLKEAGIRTALDTSGIGSLDGAEAVLRYTDLVLCDLKFSSEEGYRKYCGGSLEQVLTFLRRTDTLQIPLWIRHVVVPGLTDEKRSVREIAEIARRFSNLNRVELLPFRTLCTAKYEAMGISFPLGANGECPDHTIRTLYEFL